MAFGKRFDVEKVANDMLRLRNEASKLYVESLTYRTEASDAKLNGDVDTVTTCLEKHRTARALAGQKIAEAEALYEKSLQHLRDRAS